MEKGLLDSERIIVLSLLAIIFSLFAIAKINHSRSSPEFILPPSSEESLIVVQIQGAVARPGEYAVPVGTSLKKILAKSRPKKFANLRELDLDRPVQEPLFLEIGELKEIEVRVEGAVKNSLSLTLPAGTRVSDLKAKIPLAEEADLQALKSRRMLLDGELFLVPRKRD